jgi:hypothetical protein
MKTKLTLTVEDELIPRAKRYASAKGISLSEMVETALRQMTASPGNVPFGVRWKGRLTEVGKNSTRYRTLARRYL